MSSEILYSSPVLHKNIYISQVSSTVTHNKIDIKINKIYKSSNNNGYILNIYTDHNDELFLKNIDDIALLSLLSNNDNWFKNSLSEDDIKYMFKRSFCSQTNTMVATITNYTNIFVEGKRIEIEDFVKILSDISQMKQYTVNITLQLSGLYIQTSHTNNKWVIKCVNLYTTDEIDTDSKDELEEFWGTMLEECEKTLNNRISMIEKNKRNLKDLYSCIAKTKNPKDWDNKISEFKKLIQNIIF